MTITVLKVISVTALCVSIVTLAIACWHSPRGS